MARRRYAAAAHGRRQRCRPVFARLTPSRRRHIRPRVLILLGEYPADIYARCCDDATCRGVFQRYMPPGDDQCMPASIAERESPAASFVIGTSKMSAFNGHASRRGSVIDDALHSACRMVTFCRLRRRSIFDVMTLPDGVVANSRGVYGSHEEMLALTVRNDIVLRAACG